MRQALRQNRARSQTAATRSIPFPVEGWDTESALPAMKPTRAVILDNMIPRGAYGEIRRGFVEQATGTGASVETLAVYKGAAASDKLFACVGVNIYDVTTAGALPASSYASAVSARWNYENFANDGGRFLMLANGVQAMVKYDGSTFAAVTWTYSGSASGFSNTAFSFVFAHKARLHLIQKNTLRVWFGGVNAISGDVGLLDLGPIFTEGGSLVGGARLTIDGGNGPDDYAVYLTSKGQLAIYQGLDPADDTNWSLVGVYQLPKPLGDRCIMPYGADIAILTEAGLIPLSVALRTPENEQRNISLSGRITTAVSDAAKAYSANFGWQVVSYAGRGGLILVNVPTVELATSVQYVRANGGAWCRFTGLPAYCWAVANGNPYFGSADGIYRWDYGASDNSEPIVADLLPAFQDFGDRTRTKDFAMVRALLRAPAIVTPALDVVTDFDKNTIPTDIQSVVTPSDISPDDSDLIRNDWTGAAGSGYYGAPRMRIAITGSNDVDRVADTDDHTELLLVGPAGTDHVLTRPNLPLDVTVQCVGFDVLFKAGSVL